MKSELRVRLYAILFLALVETVAGLFLRLKFTTDALLPSPPHAHLLFWAVAPGYLLVFPFLEGPHSDPPLLVVCLLSWLSYALVAWACIGVVYSLGRRRKFGLHRGNRQTRTVGDVEANKP